MKAIVSLADPIEISAQSSIKVDTIHILHVDDDPTNLEMSKLIMQDLNSNFEIDNALCTNEAFLKISNKNYDVIVSDYEMPNKNGLDFLRELKERNSQTPFILFTGKGREEIAVKALNLGADGYYNKQGDPETVYTELSYAINYAVTRKRAEAKLQETQHLNQKILNSTPNLIYIYDLEENRNIYSNKEVTDFLGYTAEQVQAMGSKLFDNILHPDDAKAVDEHHKRFLNAPDDAVYELDYRMKHANGEWRWLHSHDTIFTKTPEGKGKQILGICEDITNRKKTETELKTKYESLEKVTESMDAGLVILGKDYRVVWSNSKLRKVGFLPNQKCFKTFERAEVCPDCGVKKVLEENLPIEVHDYKHVDASGNIGWSELRSTPLKDKDGKVCAVLELEVPITERKKTEETLKQTSQIVNSIINSTDDDIYAVDRNFNFLFVNEALAKIVKSSPERMIGKSVWSMFSKITNTELETNLRQALERNEKRTFLWKGVYTKRYKEFTICPFENGLAVFAKDITEQKNAQTKIDNEHAKLKVASEKLKVVGSLTRHDVRNKQTIIKANTYLLRKKIGNNPELLKLLQNIDSAVEESDYIFEFSRLYEKIGANKQSLVNVKESFNQAIRLFSKDSKTVFENNCGGLQVIADTMLSEVFYNLIDNSLKHGEKVTQITLTCQKENGATMLIFADNGVGVPEEAKNKIFEGYTTGGSGLGLKLVKRMVEAYGWIIKENGVPEQGARFEITIPT